MASTQILLTGFGDWAGSSNNPAQAVALALDIDLGTALRIEIAPLSITRLSHRLVDGVHRWSVGCINLEVGG